MLDDLKKIQDIDKSNMFGIVSRLPENIEETIEISIPRVPDFVPKNIIITGMGGSAISGDIVLSWLFDKINVPIIVNRGYELPKFANSNTLVIPISYSGNTEETLSCFNDALNKKCKILAITSNGKLKNLCIEKEIHHIIVPSGIATRAALPYLLFTLITVLQKLNLISAKEEIIDTISTLKDLRTKIIPEVKIKNNIPKKIAISIKDTYPVIYGHSYYSPIAKRWRTQLNENAKVLASDYEFVETNHNDIVGWNPGSIVNDFSVIFLRDNDERIEIKKRIDLVETLVFEKNAINIFEVFGYGNSKLAKMMTLLYLGDFVSLYLAVLNNVDPTPVKIIEELKKELVR